LAVVGAQLRPTSLNVWAAFTTRRLAADRRPGLSSKRLTSRHAELPRLELRGREIALSRRGMELSTARPHWLTFSINCVSECHASLQPKSVGHHRCRNSCGLAGRQSDGRWRVRANWRSDSRLDWCIYWRLAAAPTWRPLRHRHHSLNYQRLYRRGCTPADPSASLRWVGVQTPLGAALALAHIASPACCSTAKPSAVRSQRLCLVLHTYRFLGR